MRAEGAVFGTVTMEGVKPMSCACRRQCQRSVRHSRPPSEAHHLDREPSEQPNRADAPRARLEHEQLLAPIRLLRHSELPPVLQANRAAPSTDAVLFFENNDPGPSSHGGVEGAEEVVRSRKAGETTAEDGQSVLRRGIRAAVCCEEGRREVQPSEVDERRRPWPHASWATAPGCTNDRLRDHEHLRWSSQRCRDVPVARRSDSADEKVDVQVGRCAGANGSQAALYSFIEAVQHQSSSLEALCGARRASLSERGGARLLQRSRRLSIRQCVSCRRPV